MSDHGVEADIAFIRNALEEGRSYARRRSPDMAVWGLFVAAGYLATYASVRGWWSASPAWIWLVAIVLPWAYSLRRFWMPGGALVGRRSPVAQMMSMLWLGCGISLMVLAVAANWGGGSHWYNAAMASVLAIGFFGSSFLTNVTWLRLIAVAWWVSALVMYAIEDGATSLLVGAAMMLLFLAAPGFLLFASSRERG
jgi:hypothetical protein